MNVLPTLPSALRPTNLPLAAAFLLTTILTLVLRTHAPSLPWLLPPAFLFILTTHSLLSPRATHQHPSTNRLTRAHPHLLPLLTICIAVLLAHLTLTFSRAAAHYDPSIRTFWFDDREFYLQASALTAAWKSHLFPDISLKGSEPYFMGTLHTGYQRALAALFYLFSTRAAIGLLLNAITAATLPVFAYLLVRDLKIAPLPNTTNTATLSDLSATPPISPSTSASAAPLLAALLTALHPTQFYWSAFLLKDLYLTGWFLAALWLLNRVLLHRDAAALIIFAAAIYILLTIRVYAAASLIVAALAYMVAALPRRSAWGIFLGSALFLILAASYTDRGAARFEQMWSSLVELGPANLRSPAQIAVHLLAGIPRLILGPFAWLAGRGPKPLYGLYPGMWYLYLVIYPAAIVGLIYTIRNNIKIAAVPIMAVLGGAFILLTASYGGDAPRQRYYMEYVAIAFASIGALLPKRRTFITWYAILAVYLLGQLITVRLRHI